MIIHNDVDKGRGSSMKNTGTNVLIKFNNEEIVINNRKSTTMLEHLDILKKKGKVIWGQGSHRIKKLADNRIKLINEKIKAKGYTYIFFVTSKSINRERDVYVGRCVKLFVKGDLSKYSEEIKYVPEYYSSSIGTELDDNIALFEINEIVNISESYLEELYLLSNKDQQVMKVKNMNSLFYITMHEKIEVEIEKEFRLNPRNKKNFISLDENYQNAVENIIGVNNQLIEESKGKYTISSGERFKRDPSRGKNAIVRAKYECELDLNHKFFISNVTGENYVEAHHLIPMEYSELFNGINIDVEENIVSLCIVCHKKLHHGNLDDKIIILKKLFDDRYNELKNKGVNITFEELIKLY